MRPVHQVGPGLDRDQGLGPAADDRHRACRRTRPAARRALYRRPRLQLSLLLSAPTAWLVLAYLGSLTVLFLSAFWTTDSFTSNVVKIWNTDNFTALFTTDVYRQVALRSVGVALAVTALCVLIAFPIAFYTARIANPRWRPLLVVAILTPLWASYLVKAYAWRLILAQGGLLDWVLGPLGLKGPGYGLTATVLVLTYLWLPYMILPIHAGLEQLPDSLLDASADLGARTGRTFRSVVLPMILPSVAAARSSPSRSASATTSPYRSSAARPS